MRSIFWIVSCFFFLLTDVTAGVFYFPHVADGQGTYTVFTISNHSDATATGSLSLFDDLSVPLTLPFVAGPRSTLPLSLAPHSTQIFITTGISNPVAAGYAKVELSEEDVTGAAMFRYGDGREATVLPCKTGSRMSFYVERSSELQTGIAVFRDGALPLELSFYNTSGKLIQSFSYQFSGRRTAKFLNEIFPVPLPASFTGSLVIESGTSFAAIGLRFGPSILSVVPAFDFVSSQVYVSPNGGVEDALLNAIQEANAQIDVAVYSFTSEPLGTALIAAKNRGLIVRVAVDLSQGTQPGQQTDRLIAAGIPVAKVKSMDHRFAIFDSHRVMTGNYDWTPAAGTTHYDDVLFNSDPAVVLEYIKQFARLNH